jgi:hypothetical protein
MMPRTDEEQALDAVVADMSNAARQFKASKYAPKPTPVEPVAEAPADAPQLGAAELESLLANGG